MLKIKKINSIILVLFLILISCNNVKSNGDDSKKDTSKEAIFKSEKIEKKKRGEKESEKVEKNSGVSHEISERNDRDDKKSLKDSLKLYTNINRFSETTRNQFNAKGFQKYHMITTKRIDPTGKEVMDKESIKKYLDQKFPNGARNELLIINWEQEKFWNLKKKNSSKEFKEAEKEFIELVRYIKELKPNLLVGIYGLPFRVFVNKYPSYAKKGKFISLLKEVDIIAPSLYSAFTDEEKSEKENNLYLKNSIELAIEYADQANKPIYFFVWEMTSNKNKRLLPIEEFERKINTIVDYSNKNQWVQGIIYWTPTNADFYLNELKTNESRMSNTKNADALKNEIISNYVSKIF